MDGICRLVPKHMRWHTESFFAILRMGLPLAITSVLYPISYLLTQPALNSFGSVAIAGTSSAGQLDCFPAAIHAAFGTAVSVFIGQNLGANKPERVKSSIFHAAWIGTLSNTVVGVFLWLTGRFWLGLLIGFENVEAIDYGMGHLLFITAVYAIPTLGTVLNHSIQSFGYPSVSSVISLSCVLGFRAFWMLLIYPLYPTFPCLMFCYTATWILQALVISTLFFFFYRRFRRGKYKKL
jgi:Na+-driven multidrug efflux pump